MDEAANHRHGCDRVDRDIQTIAQWRTENGLDVPGLESCDALSREYDAFPDGISALQKGVPHLAAINRQWTTRSADVLLGVLGAFAGYAIISEMNMLNAASALGAGYMSDSIANAAAERNRKIVTGGKP